MEAVLSFFLSPEPHMSDITRQQSQKTMNKKIYNKTSW